MRGEQRRRACADPSIGLVTPVSRSLRRSARPRGSRSNPPSTSGRWRCRSRARERVVRDASTTAVAASAGSRTPRCARSASRRREGVAAVAAGDDLGRVVREAQRGSPRATRASFSRSSAVLRSIASSVRPASAAAATRAAIRSASSGSGSRAGVLRARAGARRASARGCTRTRTARWRKRPRRA